MKRWVLWLPLALFLGFVLVVAIMLRSPSEPVIRSQLIGKSVPAFALPAALPGKPGLAAADLASGKPRLVNVFASWCVPCRAEAPQLLQLAEAGVTIDAIAIRDTPQDIRQFLDAYGDPYRAIGNDKNSAVQLALGSAGVPESFVVDGQGIVRLQHIGVIRPEDVAPILRSIEAAR